MSQRGWIGVDLDGTLAHYKTGDGVAIVGNPIGAMVARVKAWRSEGIEVRIFTARVAGPRDSSFVENQVAMIATWCALHIGEQLPITHEKDFMMVELWDDRAVQVIPNTGKRADGLDE